ncbi:hypothetical protein QJS10_CPA01g00298 [Acorus calamus]|uniref:IST1-like protein n=1 Tax=Acorus calamus TaxID=4465 RepID=A0AAV9FIU9_ACOCL|nr:hypothetical protein QJS10_CPA01g00298 [Acorus calamus]
MAIGSDSPVVVSLKKIMGFGVSLFGGRIFNPSRCKTTAKMATARIKLLRNRREAQVRQMRRDVALLLESGQDATARIRVEHVIREQNIMAANEIIELFCELIVLRLSIIAKQRECPADLKEGIASLIFAAPRCSDIPELTRLRDIFEKKYGKDFVSSATDLCPSCGVNSALIERLSLRTPTGEVKLKIMKEIAKEYQVQWDTTETETELLKPPEPPLGGPRSFVSASSLPVKSASLRSVETMVPNNSETQSTITEKQTTMHFKDSAAAAKVAAESAEKAIAAARAAEYLAKLESHQTDQTAVNGFDTPLSSNKNAPETHHTQSDGSSNFPRRFQESQSYNQSMSEGNKETGFANSEVKMDRRHSYNAPKVHSDIKFDDSDGFDSDSDEEIRMDAPSRLPPNRPPPPLRRPYDDYHAEDRAESENSSGSLKHDLIHRVHPKLPDYDSLTARFESLKTRRYS